MQNHPGTLVSVRQAILAAADEHGIAKLAEVGNHLREHGAVWRIPGVVAVRAASCQHRADCAHASIMMRAGRLVKEKA